MSSSCSSRPLRTVRASASLLALSKVKASISCCLSVTAAATWTCKIWRISQWKLANTHQGALTLCLVSKHMDGFLRSIPPPHT